VFSETFEQHLINAKEFQKAQDVEQEKRMAAHEDTETHK
jgi:hypothetical protein